MCYNNSSAIWMALSAAPFRIWSPHTNSSSPLPGAWLMSSRSRPTYTSSFPVASSGVGNRLAARSLMRGAQSQSRNPKKTWVL